MFHWFQSNRGSVAGEVTMLFNGENVARYESGEMTDDEIIRFFQVGVDSGIVWQLQGGYGRTAADLIASGYVKAATR